MIELDNRLIDTDSGLALGAVVKSLFSLRDFDLSGLNERT